MNRTAIALIRMYQLTLGRVMPGRCRFYPTCSAYAIECFERFSFFRALLKTVYRLGRCTPFSTGYFDPVIHEGETGAATASSLQQCNHNHNH